MIPYEPYLIENTFPVQRFFIFFPTLPQMEKANKTDARTHTHTHPLLKDELSVRDAGCCQFF